MINGRAAFIHHLLEITLPYAIAAEPTNRPKDDFALKITPLQLCYRQPRDLANILSAIDTHRNEWWIIDGGGNRSAFDAEMTQPVDLVFLPLRDREEDLEAVTRDLHAYPNALARPCALPTDDKTRQSAKHFVEALTSLATSTVWFASFAQT